MCSPVRPKCNGIQGSYCTGFREWNDTLVKALAQVNMEYRVVLKAIIQAIDQEEKLAFDRLDRWSHWQKWKMVVNVDLGKLSEDMKFSENGYDEW